MRKAVIDLGTNTFQLIVADVFPDKIDILFKKQHAVKLGEAGIEKNQISLHAWQRAINALSDLHGILKDYGCSEVKLIGTSALRNAINAKDFIKEVLERFGYSIEVIDGLREAKYILNGVTHTLPKSLLAESFMVMDIGGGSVEFIINNVEKSEQLFSFEMGCARLLERFHKSDPIQAEDIAAMKSFIHSFLAKIPKSIQINTLIGAAGSFESLLQLNDELLEEQSTLTNDNLHKIDLANFKSLYHKLLRSTYAERNSWPLLQGYKAEMIVSGFVLIDCVLERFGCKNIYCSKFSLKEGALLG
jgi:exopolyphosphatase/guanosine-5'-triphosphate,3'-diphosphate pyrophosphatase